MNEYVFFVYHFNMYIRFRNVHTIDCVFWFCSSQELDVTWAQMEFGHDVHQRTGLKFINASEELIETLEDNQVNALTKGEWIMYRFSLCSTYSIYTAKCMYYTTVSLTDFSSPSGSVAKHDDIQVCRLLFGTSLCLAEEVGYL